MTQKKLFRTIGAVATALMLITLAGACNGLLPDETGAGGTADGGGGNVVINLSGLPAELTNRAAGQARGVVQFDQPRQYVNYYEVFFMQRTATFANRKIVAKAESVRGESRLVLTVPANDGATALVTDQYEILVLAGAYANNDSTNGEKVLLGSGYMKNVTVRSGVRNTFIVKMYEVKARVDVWGVPKGTRIGGAAALADGAAGTSAPSAAYVYTDSADPSPAPLPMVKNPRTGLNYVQLEKQIAPYNTGGTPAQVNPWTSTTNTAHKLTIGVALTGLDPLILAAGTGTLPAPTAPASTAAGSIFALNTHEARIVTLSTTAFPMNPVQYKYEGVMGAATALNGTWDARTIAATSPTELLTASVYSYQPTTMPGLATDNTTLSTPTTQRSITFLYSDTAWKDTTYTVPGIIGKIPDSDAAGVFYFNYKYYPFGLESAGSVWNIRNRLLWSNGRYYGGGVVLLFGNAGTEWVEVVPTY